jgi:hypothetical protein
MKITRTKQLEELQPTPSWKPKTITVGGNKTKTVFKGVSAKPDAPVKKFSSIVNKSTSDFNRLTAEDHIDDHRSANGELPWKKRNVSADQVAAVKRAALKSREAQKQDLEEHQIFNVNETAMAILRRARDLKETITPAQQTIVAHGTSAQAVAAALPKAWTNSDEAPVMAVKDVDTRSALPDEFRPQTAAEKAKANTLKGWTDAARTLDKGNPAFRDQSRNDQGLISVNQPFAKAASTLNSGSNSYKERDQKKTRQALDYNS